MNCPQCGVANADDVERCSGCSHEFASARPTLVRPESIVTVVEEPPAPAPTGSGSRRPRYASFFDGQAISSRYRIVRRLGEGGMGEVYLAHDGELDRDVALKLIHTDLAESPAIMERFKREIQLSSRITHKNVLRVYDLGEAQGVKFLTMQYVEGEDLASLMRREGPLPTNRIVDIFRQMCHGLVAAHEQGVIHRDLKPQNIMIEKSGRVSVTDFGLAKTFQQTTLTDAGKIVGTPHYMSPEQVRGLPIDQRSDIFALGIILYEMLTGTVPFGGSSAYEIMIARVNSRPRPATEFNPNIPPYLLRIVERCLETDTNLRYGSAEEILRDLDAQTFHSSLAYEMGRRRRLLRWAGAILVALIVIASLTYGWRRFRGNPSRAAETLHKPVSVLIADIENRTGQKVLDGTLEPVLTLALEGASFITSYDRVQAHKVATQIRSGATALDEAMSRLVAAREGINIIITGSVSRDGDGYALSLQAIDGITGKRIENTDVTADSNEKLLAAVSRAAADLRNALGDTTSTSAQLAAAETFTAGSLEAAHEYALGQDLFYSGKFEEAAKHYEQATRLDPNLGRAYAGLAASYSNMGRRSDAEKYYRQAMAHIDRMTDREKYRTRGTYYLVMHNTPRAIEELSELVRQYPADMAGLNNLALAYFYQRDMSRALDASQKPIDLYPKNAIARSNAALYAMYAGEFDLAIKQAGRVVETNPGYSASYVAIALSQLAKNEVDAAIATYQKLAAQGARGQSIANQGLADIALYEGRNRDAAALLREGVQQDVAANRQDAANKKLATLAEVVVDAKAAETAAAGSHAEHAVFTAARALLAANKEQRALTIASQLATQIAPEVQHYGKLIEGEVLLRRGNAREALNRFEDARRLADSWLAHFDRGRAYLELNAFTEANADFENCLNRSGEATAVFLDDSPTYHFFPPVYYYLGRAREGLGSASAADSYRQYLTIKTKGDGDPLVADARRRLALIKP